MKLRALILVVCLGVSISALVAQTFPEKEAARARISEALAKGDTATAEKYFAEVAKTVAQGNPFFEEIRACGFYPQETRLECIVDVKQAFGYGGPIGSFGSFEHVAFFVDFDGTGFQTTDYVGTGIVHITDGSAQTHFAVYRDFNPPGGPRTSNGGNSTTTMTTGPILRARAILSWMFPICNPNQVPVWGSVLDFRIRMMPIR